MRRITLHLRYGDSSDDLVGAWKRFVEQGETDEAYVEALRTLGVEPSRKD